MADSNPPAVVFSSSDESLPAFIPYSGFWCPQRCIEGVKAMLNPSDGFEALEDDVIIASGFKTGTTWMKALVYAIVNYKEGKPEHLEDKDHPLNQKNPHEVVPTIEVELFGPYAQLNISDLRPPRVLHTHLPYHALPHSVHVLGCKMIYVARNPKDTFVSLWQFYNKLHTDGITPEGVAKEEAFQGFCSGVFHYGPFVQHVGGYWENSRIKPNHILFLTYEDLQADSKSCLRKLVDFLGRSRLGDDDIEKIAAKCSFESLSGLKVNRSGGMKQTGLQLRNDSFFRQGKVGGWKNFFTAEMNEQVNKIMEEKLVNDLGLQFKYEL